MIYLQVILYVFSWYTCLKTLSCWRCIPLIGKYFETIIDMLLWVTDPLLNFTFESDFMIVALKELFVC